jgi:hypothetical protein
MIKSFTGPKKGRRTDVDAEVLQYIIEKLGNGMPVIWQAMKL